MTDRVWKVLWACVVIAVMFFVIGNPWQFPDEPTAQENARAQLRNLKTAVIAYKMRNRALPPSIEDLAAEGYLETDCIPPDPWGNPYRYRTDGTHFTLLSQGSDGRPGGTGEAADIMPYVPDRP